MKRSNTCVEKQDSVSQRGGHWLLKGSQVVRKSGRKWCKTSGRAWAFVGVRSVSKRGPTASQVGSGPGVRKLGGSTTQH